MLKRASSKEGTVWCKKGKYPLILKAEKGKQGASLVQKSKYLLIKRVKPHRPSLATKTIQKRLVTKQLEPLKKEKNKNTTSLLKYNTTHLSRTFPLFQGAHTQNHPLAVHRKREDTKGTNALFAI